MAKRTVAVVDDDESVRDSISCLLEQQGYPVELFETAEDLLIWIKPGADAAILTDVRMPGMDGMQLIDALRSRHCHQPIIVITGHGDIPLAVRAMKAGVADFFEKPFETAALLGAIERVIVGLESAIDVNEQRAIVNQRIMTLSQRESQVLNELIEGKSNKMIAASLSISPRTVEIYRANVMAKMQAASLSALVRMSMLVQAA